MHDEPTTPDLGELTRRLFDAASARDLDAVMRCFGPESVWDVEPWGLGTHVGPAAIRRFLDGWIGSFDEYQVNVEEILELGNGVVLAVATQHGRSAHTRGELRLRYAPVFLWAQGVAVRVTHYRDIDEARAAAQRLAEEQGTSEIGLLPAAGPGRRG
jgi:ketosteroid isomerase-like protein